MKDEQILLSQLSSNLLDQEISEDELKQGKVTRPRFSPNYPGVIQIMPSGYKPIRSLPYPLPHPEKK